ncbi:MAG: hypothetical protein IJN62_04835 [Clostridia bacterium]|nr:hypothetical protein [Clostridia bacterium]
MKNKEMAFSLLGLLSGFMSIIFSFVIFCMDNGSWENSLQYGGDAYTGIQNAAAQTANNIQVVCDVLRIGLGAVLFVGGMVLICIFGLKFANIREQQKISADGDVEIKINDLLEAPAEETVITEEFFETEEIPVPEVDKYTE